jgi:curli biogenesis system outer membrane secretion channel CsgG
MNGLETLRLIGTWAVAVTFVVGASSVRAQGAQTKAAPAKPAPARAAAAAKPTTPVDQVIALVKSKLSEDLIIRAIAKESLHADLGSADMLKLKNAGVTDKVIGAMMDGPAAAAAPAAAPEAVATAAPAAEAPTAAPAAPAALTREQMRRAAIDEFDWATVRTSVQAVFGTNIDVGKGLRALLTKRVQEGGKIRIVERAKAETLIKEQDFGASNRVKQGTNARVGQILGADVYLMGDIVAFGRDDRKQSVNLGGAGFRGAFGAAIRGASQEDKAVIVVNYRLVDAETSEVIDAGEARGESKRKSKGFAGIFANSRGVAGGGVDMTSSNFSETIIGEAVMDAADKLAAIMNDKFGNLPRRELDIEARVANITGNAVTIAAGSSQGVATGDRFEVYRIVKEIKDPVTGEVLDNEVARLGELTITTVRERVATGTYKGAAVTAKDGIARKIMQ